MINLADQLNRSADQFKLNPRVSKALAPGSSSGLELDQLSSFNCRLVGMLG